jgi:hypothetical protein
MEILEGSLVFVVGMLAGMAAMVAVDYLKSRNVAVEIEPEVQLEAYIAEKKTEGVEVRSRM